MMELIKCVLALPNVDAVVVRCGRGEEEEGGREVCLPASQPAKYCTNSPNLLLMMRLLLY